MTDPDWRPHAGLAALRARAAAFAQIRAFMAEHDVLEVDTGVLTSSAACERALDSFAVGDAGFLAASPEYALKRLLAAGSGAVYQLGHVFRAGEQGRWHNPEFCMLEWYRPGMGMATAIDETEALVAAVAGVGCARRQRYADVFAEHVGVDPLTADAGALRAAAARHAVAPAGAGHADRVFWLDLLMGVVVQPRLGHDAPLCVTDFPADDAVLVECDEAAGVARRFECYWRGVELANGARELTDASVARERMDREIAARDARHAPLARDERVLAAIAAGMPAAAGVALGVDRLLALSLGCDRLAPVLPFAWSRR